MKLLKMTTAALALMAAPALAYESMKETEANAAASVLIPSQETNPTQYDAQNDAERASAMPEMDGEAGFEGEGMTDMDMAEFATDFEIEGWMESDTELTAEDLTGMPLYDATNTWIGEIDEVIVSEAGDITGAVLGVGGFVGIGEKDVLVSFDSLKIKEPADGDDLRVYVDTTQEQLEAMPSYNS